MKLTIIYVILALIATVANMVVQELVMQISNGSLVVPLSMMIGTGVGLLVKYMLDKRYIFCFRAHDAGHDRQMFLLYTTMGLATTAIFWGFEFGFHCLFDAREMRYLGGVIGLAIGYFAKYHLDKRFVFRLEIP